MDSQQHGMEFKKVPHYRVDSICCCNVGDEGDNDDTAKVVISNINVDNIETEDTGTVSSIVRACDTDVSHYNKTDNL